MSQSQLTESKLDDVLAPAPPSLVTTYHRGKSYSNDIRARVMLLLQQHVSKAEIARRLQVSAKTVRRYQQAAMRQALSVPTPEPQGGHRSSIALLNRNQIVAIANLLLAKPKLTVA